MTAPRLTLFALFAALGLTLSGCEMAEDSAQKLTEKASEAAKEIARETVSDTVNALNEHIDSAQKSTNELLGKPADETAEDKQPQRDDEAAEEERNEGVEI